MPPSGVTCTTLATIFAESICWGSAHRTSNVIDPIIHSCPSHLPTFPTLVTAGADQGLREANGLSSGA